MSLRKISALAAAGLLAVTGIASVFAQDAATPDPKYASMTPEQLVDARQAAMEENGKTLKGAKDQTGDAAVAAAQTLVTNFTNLPAMFPEGSIVGDSKALPAIWENWDTFTGIFAKDRAAADAALTAAKAGDHDAYVAALAPIGQSCGECHQQFRAK
jgi:cytochrome c556